MNTTDTLEILLDVPALSAQEADDLWRCEVGIEEQHGGLEGVSQLLKEIKDKRLYRTNYSTFAQFAHRRLGWSTVKLQMALAGIAPDDTAKPKTPPQQIELL